MKTNNDTNRLDREMKTGALHLNQTVPRPPRARRAMACAMALGTALLLTGALPSAHAAVTEAWVKRHTNGVANAVAVDASGNVVVTGSSHNGNNFDYYTAKYAAADGALLWEKRYNGPANSGDTARALALDSSGNAVVTGSSTNSSGNSDYYTAKYAAADGALLWEKRYNGPANRSDTASALALDSSGNVVVTGASHNGIYIDDYYTDYYTAKYAAANGTLLWEKRYNGPTGLRDFANAVAVDAAGNVVVTGESSGSSSGSGSSPDYYTAKYAAANGALLWEKRYNGYPTIDILDFATAVAVDSSGNVVVTGGSATPPGPYAYVQSYTAKYAAADGALLWEKRYGPFCQFGCGYESLDVTVDGADSVLVTGVSGTFKYLADGTAVWTNRTTAFAVAVDGSSNVVVLGLAHNGNNYDYYTASYAAADGARLWEQRYNGPANGGDEASAFALGPDGMIAVTGTSSGDYATVVYVDIRQPRILTQPLDQAIEIGASAFFTIVATNAASLPMTYEWFFNTTNSVGVTSSTLALNNVTGAQLGGYSVVVSNAFNVVTSRVAILLTSAPLILTQPSDVAVKATSNALFTVTATNGASSPMSYQWFFNETTPVGVSSATLLVPNVGAAQLGGYSVVVSNASGIVTSRVASLDFQYPPVIVTQPQNQTNMVGDNVTFTVTVTNNATLPITYQWRKGSILLTNSVLNSRTGSFTLFNVATNVTTTNGPGNYRVVAMNAANTVGLPSSFATLTVLSVTAPTIIAYDLLGPGGFRLRFDSTAGTSYSVLVSTNLSDWTALGPATELTPGHFEFTDADAPGHPTRFYRLRTP